MNKMNNIIFKKCAEDNIQIHPHCNSPYCSQKILEINPAKSCQFQCQYCCVYTQENAQDFLPLTIYEDYPELLEYYIKEHKDDLNGATFFYSFETDCLEDGLVKTGMTERILNVLSEYKQRYFLLTKGKLEDDTIAKLLIQSKEFAQVIVNDTMPDENFRKVLEPHTATNKERYNLIKFCLENGISSTISFSPILPFCGLDYVKEKIELYSKIGIHHFRFDMLELSKDSFDKIVGLVPNYKQQMEDMYLAENSMKNHWVSPITKKKIDRFKPSEEKISQMYYELKNFVKFINQDATVSICDGVIATNELLNGYNCEAYKNGFNCMGIKYR